MEGYIEIEKYSQLEVEFVAHKLSSRQEIEQLKFQLEQLKRMLFGAKSERFIPEVSSDQLSLFGKPAEEEAAKIEVPAHQRVKNKRKEKPTRLVLPDHLEREETIIEPEVDTIGMVKIGEERTEVLVYTPASLKVKLTIRPKFAPKDKTEKGIVIAPLPARFIDRCIADETLLTVILVDKYYDHLPLNRIGSRFERLGMRIPQSTMCGWVAQSADKLRVLYSKLIELVLQSEYLMVDERRMQVLTNNSPPKRYRKKPKKSRTHRGFMWGYLAVKEKLLFFEYDPSHSSANPAKRLKNFKGTFQTDAYKIYDQIRKAYPDLTH